MGNTARPRISLSIDTQVYQNRTILGYISLSFAIWIRYSTPTAPAPVVAVTEGRDALDNGFFRARWDRATQAERSYLVAMADDGASPSGSAKVAQRLGKQHSQLGPARANLINKGLIYAPEHGQIAYTVPGMASFIGRQPG